MDKKISIGKLIRLVPAFIGLVLVAVGLFVALPIMSGNSISPMHPFPFFCIYHFCHVYYTTSVSVVNASNSILLVTESQGISARSTSFH